jgi:hypothetical protein
MISIHRLFDYDIFHFSKRGYTEKYPKVVIPQNLSKPAVRNIIGHLQKVLDSPQDDKEKFDGTKNKDYEEKIST